MNKNLESVTLLLMESHMLFGRLIYGPTPSGDPDLNQELADLALQHFDEVITVEMNDMIGEATEDEIDTALTNGRRVLGLMKANLGLAVEVDPFAANFARKLLEIGIEPSIED